MTIETTPLAPTTLAPPGLSTLRIRPKTGWQPLDVAELWSYRELLLILAMRDVKVRYKQTVLGVAWAIIQPLATMVAFTAIASLGKLSSDGVPRPLFQYAALLPWYLFANSLTAAGTSLITNQNLITKVYFPRLVIPIASVITGLIDFTISFGVLMLMMAGYRFLPPAQVLLLPVFIAMAFAAALAVGLWAAALSVEFRDVRYVIPFIVQIGLLSILIPSSSVTTPWKRVLIGLNPMTGVIDGFRWCLLGREAHAPGLMLLTSATSITVLLVSGLFYFRRMEKSFADLV